MCDLWIIQYYNFPADANLEDAGMYMCQVENAFGKLQYETRVDITGIGK
jgi:hypothetical protein